MSDRARAVLEERARRLARPLASAGPSDDLEVVTFTMAGEMYAVESRYVLEACRPAGVTPLPGVAAPVIGVTARRGELLVLLDLRGAMGAAAAAPPVAADSGRILVLGEERRAIGVVTDSVQELRRLPAAEVRAVSDSPIVDRKYVRGITADAILVLDGAALIRDHT